MRTKQPIGKVTLFGEYIGNIYWWDELIFNSDIYWWDELIFNHGMNYIHGTFSYYLDI